MKEPCRFCGARRRCVDAINNINVCCHLFHLDPDLPEEEKKKYAEYEYEKEKSVYA